MAATETKAAIPKPFVKQKKKLIRSVNCNNCGAPRKEVSSQCNYCGTRYYK